MELGSVGSHRNGVARYHANNSEERSLRLPAFRAAASMIVNNIAFQGDSHFLRGTAAVKSTPCEVSGTLVIPLSITGWSENAIVMKC